jgi:hypothetical protein
MKSNQPIADILLWDCDNHPEKKGGKRLFRMGQGNTKTYLKQLLEDINGCSEYGRDMVNKLHEKRVKRSRNKHNQPGGAGETGSATPAAPSKEDLPTTTHVL